MFIFGRVIQCLQVWGLCAGPLHRRKAPCGCSSSSRQSAGRHSGTNRRNTGRYVFSFRCGHHLIPWPQENDHVLCVTGNIPKRKIQKCVKGSLRIESYCLTAYLIHFSTSCFFFFSFICFSQKIPTLTSDWKLRYLSWRSRGKRWVYFRNEILYVSIPKRMYLKVLSLLLSFFPLMRGGQKSTEPWNSTTERM